MYSRRGAIILDVLLIAFFDIGPWLGVVEPPRTPGDGGPERFCWALDAPRLFFYRVRIIFLLTNNKYNFLPSYENFEESRHNRYLGDQPQNMTFDFILAFIFDIKKTCKSKAFIVKPMVLTCFYLPKPFVF